MKRITAYTFLPLLLALALPIKAAPYYSTYVDLIFCENFSCTTENSTFDGRFDSPAQSELVDATLYDLRASEMSNTVAFETTITASGSASSSSTGLKAKVSGEQITEELTLISNAGLPVGPGQPYIESGARFLDTLEVVGASGLSTVTYSLNIHGVRPDDYYTSFIQVTGPGIIFGSNNAQWDGITDFDIVLTSGEIDVSSGELAVDLRLLTNLQFFIGGEDGGLSNSGIFREVDFYNTVTIGQFQGFDAAGNPVDLVSVTGSGGQVFDTLRVAANTVAVPAPLALLLFGLAGIATARRACVR